MSLGKRIVRYRMAYVFLMPALVHYAVFGLYPMVSGLRLAFFRWDGLSPDMEFVGFSNLAAAFKDSRLWSAVGHNLALTVVSVLVTIGIGLGLALMVENIWVRLQNLAKTVLFVPHIISMVVAALIFKMLFEPNFGRVNMLLGDIGLGGLARSWLTEVNPILAFWSVALLSITAVMVWKGYGMSMVIYHAAFRALPPEVYDAARIDGARGWTLLWHVTWPLLWPITSMLIVLGTITSLQVFDVVYVLTGGGPLQRTETIAVYIVDRTFVSAGAAGELPNYGYSSAMAIVLFLLVAVVTLVNVKALRRERYD